MSSRRFVEFVVRARRLVALAPAPEAPERGRVTARRQVGGPFTQFSFRLAFMIDLVYVGLGAMGGAALGRGVADSTPASAVAGALCRGNPSMERSAGPAVDSATARIGALRTATGSSAIPHSMR